MEITIQMRSKFELRVLLYELIDSLADYVSLS